MAAAGTLGSAMLLGGPASAAPDVGVPGCTFDAGVTTCITDEVIARSVGIPRAYCIPGQAEPVLHITPSTTTYLRTTTRWRGFYVNDHQRFLGSSTETWVEVIYPDFDPGPICPV